MKRAILRLLYCVVWGALAGGLHGLKNFSYLWQFGMVIGAICGLIMFPIVLAFSHRPHIFIILTSTGTVATVVAVAVPYPESYGLEVPIYVVAFAAICTFFAGQMLTASKSSDTKNDRSTGPSDHDDANGD